MLLCTAVPFGRSRFNDLPPKRSLPGTSPCELEWAIANLLRIAIDDAIGIADVLQNRDGDSPALVLAPSW